MFASSTWPAFDALGAAATAADDVVEAILEPARLGRLVDFHRRDPGYPGAGEVLQDLVQAAFPPSAGEAPRHAALRRVVQRVVTDRLIALAARPSLRSDLRAEVEWTLRSDLGGRLEGMGEPGDRETAAHLAAIAADVERFLDRDAVAPREHGLPPDPPPGSPIGGDGMDGIDGMDFWASCGSEP
jgi:hypothetical protein